MSEHSKVACYYFKPCIHKDTDDEHCMSCKRNLNLGNNIEKTDWPEEYLKSGGTMA